MKYTLEISEKQAEIIKIALEEYFRLRMNQWGDLANDLAFTGLDYGSHDGMDFNARIERRNGTQRILEAAMDIAQPMRQHGIYPEQTTEMLRAQDIWQVIRHQLWVDRHGDDDSWCVDSREPMCMSGEALPKMKGVAE